MTRQVVCLQTYLVSSDLRVHVYVQRERPVQKVVEKRRDQVGDNPVDNLGWESPLLWHAAYGFRGSSFSHVSVCHARNSKVRRCKSTCELLHVGDSRESGDRGMPAIYFRKAPSARLCNGARVWRLPISRQSLFPGPGQRMGRPGAEGRRRANGAIRTYGKIQHPFCVSII